ncbi:MAG: type II toxin-antitoxin system HicA family toxin [Nitrosopumilaceae archaeon]|nr:type II toxin-antitoxin system HicA family toxin [Nitrosopumilaceae archaeon]
MARYLQRKGFVITQRKGSHMTLRDGGLVTVVPAGNKKLRIKAQFSILLYAGIDKEEFIDDYEHDLVK